MRVATFATALLALALLAPAASAGAIELAGGKVVEATLRPGEDHEFRMDVAVNVDGQLYAKLLPTPQSAAHDGSRANGSVADGTGWRVSFAFERTDGTREELGTYADGTLTRLVPVAAGERLTLVATTHVPASAASGGSPQRVFVAVAHRAPDSAAGGASGASMDEARAITLLHSGPSIPVPVEGDAPEESTPGPVGPIESDGATYVTVERAAPVPGWFLGGVLGLLALLVALVAWQAWTVRTLARSLQRAPWAAPHVVPVRAAPPQDALRGAESAAGERS